MPKREGEIYKIVHDELWYYEKNKTHPHAHHAAQNLAAKIEKYLIGKEGSNSRS